MYDFTISVSVVSTWCTINTPVLLEVGQQAIRAAVQVVTSNYFVSRLRRRVMTSKAAMPDETRMHAPQKKFSPDDALTQVDFSNPK